MRLILRSSAPSVAATFLLLLLAAAVHAQNTDTNTQNTDTATQKNTDTATTAAAAKTTQQTDTAKGTTTAAQSTITNVPTLSSGTDSSSDAPTTEVTNAPSISSTGSVFHLSGVPTIAGYGIPTMIVPWTAGAPYQQTSKLPEGTVFIVVGAILGFMGMSILAWRGLVAWSLHRSVKRAAANALKTDSLVKLRDPKPHYSAGGLGGGTAGSNHSLDRLSAAPTRLTKTSHGPPGSSPAGGRNSSLFFSPTAGAGNHSSPAAALLNNPANRSSAFLPAGYYAAPGASTPSPGPIGSTPSPLSSLNPLHPSRAGYRPQRDFGPSPPASPSLPPSRPSTEQLRRGNGGYAGGYERVSGYGGQMGTAGLYSQSSTSQLNLHVPGGALNGQRAPSANLEELFENHGNGPRERF
jgi:hypothetical protein